MWSRQTTGVNFRYNLVLGIAKNPSIPAGTHAGAFQIASHGRVRHGPMTAAASTAAAVTADSRDEPNFVRHLSMAAAAITAAAVTADLRDEPNFFRPWVHDHRVTAAVFWLVVLK